MSVTDVVSEQFLTGVTACITLPGGTASQVTDAADLIPETVEAGKPRVAV